MSNSTQIVTGGDIQSVDDFLDCARKPDGSRTGARRFWTTKEIALLREHYPIGGVAACLQALPGRSARSIYSTAHKEGLAVAGTPKSKGVPRQRWTSSPQMDDVIRRAYPTCTSRGAVIALAARLNRPRWWVSNRAASLGLVTPRFKEPKWTEAELELIENIASKSPKAIRATLARKGFARTETAIILKLKRIGADRQDPNHYTATGLAALMGVNPSTVSAWCEKGWLNAKRRGTERAPIQGGDMWWISRKAVRQFIIDSTAHVDIRKVDKFWFVELLAGSASP